MQIHKLLLAGLILFSSVAYALTRQDLERMKSELDNPVTLEAVEKVLLESGLSFMKMKSQNSCSYYYSHSEPHVKTFKIVIDFHSYAGKEILHRIDWGSDYAYYELVDGRFQPNESYYRHAGVSDSVMESRAKLMHSFNSILDKIENGKTLYWPHSDRCKNCAIQTMSSYSLSEQLGSRGVCNGGEYGSEKQTCNYRVGLSDGTTADVTVEYMSLRRRDDYTPVSIMFNDKQGVGDGSGNATPIRTVKIGKQEWMDHNLLYGEGLTMKYGVDIVANAEMSNITDMDVSEKSYAMPSGEANSWLVFMDLNLQQNDAFNFIEKPDIKENHQGVCPAGFHVPTRSDWKELFSFVARDKVKFLKYDLFEEYEQIVEAYQNASSETARTLKKKLGSIENELNDAYNKWRQGRNDGFYCGKSEKCRFNKSDMQNVIETEIIKYLCLKGAWPLDENGEDACLDSYGFSMPSNSITGKDMSYWTADAVVSKCRDVFENGRHQCTYEIEGYSFEVSNERQEFKFQNFKPTLTFHNANLRCLKNKGRK